MSQGSDKEPLVTPATGVPAADGAPVVAGDERVDGAPDGEAGADVHEDAAGDDVTTVEAVEDDAVEAAADDTADGDEPGVEDADADADESDEGTSEETDAETSEADGPAAQEPVAEDVAGTEEEPAADEAQPEADDAAGESEEPAEPDEAVTEEPDEPAGATVTEAEVPTADDEAELVAEKAAEPDAEKVAEPDAEKVAEPDAEKVAEPDAEKVAEPDAEKAAEPEEQPAEATAPPGAPAAVPPTDEEKEVAEPVPAPAARARERDRDVRARSRLRSAMRPRATRGQLLAAVLCAGLGFGLVVQVQQTQRSGLENLTQSELVTVLNQVNDDARRLRDNELEARAARDRLASTFGNDQEAEKLARERLEVLGILGGTLKARGPGIELVVDDPDGQVGAAILLDALQELRDAGAEVVQIGTVRVVSSTAFVDETNGISVGQTVLRPPYTFKVIGDPKTLSSAMLIPGGVLDVLEQKGASGDVTEEDEVVIDALHSPDTPRYASPAPDPTP